MKSKIQNIYIVQTVDEEHSKYMEQILIQYEKKHPRYLILFSSNSKISMGKEKYERKMKKRLRKFFPHLAKEDLSKIVFVDEEDVDTKEFVIQTIGLLKNEKYNRGENLLHLAETSTFIPGMMFSILPFTALSAVCSVLSMRVNSRRKSLPQNASGMIRKIKFGFSFCLLSMNTIYRIHDFSMNYETMYHKYKLVNDIYDVLGRREIILDTIDNPFEEGTLVVSEEDVFGILMESLDSNPLIQETDLEVASNLEQYIRENPYLDYGRLYDDFSSFGIIDTNLAYGNISGQKFDELIIVYDSSNQDELSYKRIIEHELVHRTGHLDNILLNEGMTSLIVYEYMEDFKTTDGYYDHLLVTKILCELITPDKMLEAYSKDDMDIIKNELLKLNPSMEDYQQFMGLLDQYGKQMKAYAKKGKVDEFFQSKSPQFQESLGPFIHSYMGVDLEEQKRLNIIAYLHCIGQKMNVIGDAYFNQNADEVREKAYLKE